MKKECRFCRSVSNPEAPYCDACGFEFAPERRAPPGKATWKGRMIAIGSGLVVAVAFRLLRPQ
jgi:ribosomal protein L37E